jgi:hypothetical protein
MATPFLLSAIKKSPRSTPLPSMYQMVFSQGVYKEGISLEIYFSELRKVIVELTKGSGKSLLHGVVHGIEEFDLLFRSINRASPHR